MVLVVTGGLGRCFRVAPYFHTICEFVQTTQPYEYEICIAQTGTYSKYMEATYNKD